jgi:hypothetical protein
MDGLKYLAIIFAGVLASVSIGLIKDEVAVYLPRITKKILDDAISRSPKNLIEEHRLEWSAQISNHPGKIVPFLQAILYAIAIRAFDTRNPGMRPNWVFRFILSASLFFIIIYSAVRLFTFDVALTDILGFSIVLALSRTIGHWQGYTRAEKAWNEKNTNKNKN